MGELMQLATARERRGRRERLLTKADIAAHFTVSERTVSRWMRAGLPYEQVYENGAVRFSLQECSAWCRRHRRKSRP